MAKKSDIDIVSKVLAIPSGYAKVRLQKNLHPTQKKVIDAVFSTSKEKVVFRTGNTCGKSSTVIPSVVLYAMEMKNALVIGTSATYRQIIEQTFMNIKKYSDLFPQWDFLENKIKINGETRLLFFSSDDEAQAQGWHATPDRPLLIIVDEPAGVSDEVFRAFERCQPTWILIAGSPLSPEGYFYKIETDEDIAKHFKHFKLTQPECAKSKGYWVDDSDIQLMLSSWGETHPLVLSSVYAEFSKDSENSIISLSNINAYYCNLPEYMPGERRVSLDFAAGGDSNVIVYRNGNLVKIIKAWKERDTMTAAGQIVIELNKLKEQVGLRPHEVIGDASGLGLPIIHRLAELGWNIQLFYGQSKPNDENYRNLITECWLELAKKIVNKSIILPNDNDLKAQLLGRKQRLNSSGKLELESKEDMRSRGLSSPDIADAVAMCIINTNAGAVTSIKSLPITEMSRRSIGSYC